jgi:hypothetical protein
MPRPRDPNRYNTRPVGFRMSYDALRELDILSRINKRGRREIIELLIHEAAVALKADPSDRIVP